MGYIDWWYENEQRKKKGQPPIAPSQQAPAYATPPAPPEPYISENPSSPAVIAWQQEQRAQVAAPPPPPQARVEAPTPQAPFKAPWDMGNPKDDAARLKQIGKAFSMISGGQALLPDIHLALALSGYPVDVIMNMLQVDPGSIAMPSEEQRQKAAEIMKGMPGLGPDVAPLKQGVTPLPLESPLQAQNAALAQRQESGVTGEDWQKSSSEGKRVAAEQKAQVEKQKQASPVYQGTSQLISEIDAGLPKFDEATNNLAKLQEQAATNPEAKRLLDELAAQGITLDSLAKNKDEMQNLRLGTMLRQQNWMYEDWQQYHKMRQQFEEDASLIADVFGSAEQGRELLTAQEAIEAEQRGEPVRYLQGEELQAAARTDEGFWPGAWRWFWGQQSADNSSYVAIGGKRPSPSDAHKFHMTQQYWYQQRAATMFAPEVDTIQTGLNDLLKDPAGGYTPDDPNSHSEPLLRLQKLINKNYTGSDGKPLFPVNEDGRLDDMATFLALGRISYERARIVSAIFPNDQSRDDDQADRANAYIDSFLSWLDQNKGNEYLNANMPLKYEQSKLPENVTPDFEKANKYHTTRMAYADWASKMVAVLPQYQAAKATNVSKALAPDIGSLRSYVNSNEARQILYPTASRLKDPSVTEAEFAWWWKNALGEDAVPQEIKKNLVSQNAAAFSLMQKDIAAFKEDAAQTVAPVLEHIPDPVKHEALLVSDILAETTSYLAGAAKKGIEKTPVGEAVHLATTVLDAAIEYPQRIATTLWLLTPAELSPALLIAERVRGSEEDEFNNPFGRQVLNNHHFNDIKDYAAGFREAWDKAAELQEKGIGPLSVVGQEVFGIHPEQHPDITLAANIFTDLLVMKGTGTALKSVKIGADMLGTKAFLEMGWAKSMNQLIADLAKAARSEETVMPAAEAAARAEAEAKVAGAVKVNASADLALAEDASKAAAAAGRTATLAEDTEALAAGEMLTAGEASGLASEAAMARTAQENVYKTAKVEAAKAGKASQSAEESLAAGASAAQIYRINREFGSHPELIRRLSFSDGTVEDVERIIAEYATDEGVNVRHLFEDSLTSISRQWRARLVEHDAIEALPRFMRKLTNPFPYEGVNFGLHGNPLSTVEEAAWAAGYKDKDVLKILDDLHGELIGGGSRERAMGNAIAKMERDMLEQAAVKHHGDANQWRKVRDNILKSMGIAPDEWERQVLHLPQPFMVGGKKSPEMAHIAEQKAAKWGERLRAEARAATTPIAQKLPDQAEPIIEELASYVVDEILGLADEVGASVEDTVFKKINKTIKYPTDKVSIDQETNYVARHTDDIGTTRVHDISKGKLWHEDVDWPKRNPSGGSVVAQQEFDLATIDRLTRLVKEGMQASWYAHGEVSTPEQIRKFVEAVSTKQRAMERYTNHLLLNKIDPLLEDDFIRLVADHAGTALAARNAKWWMDSQDIAILARKMGPDADVDKFVKQMQELRRWGKELSVKEQIAVFPFQVRPYMPTLLREATMYLNHGPGGLLRRLSQSTVVDKLMKTWRFLTLFGLATQLRMMSDEGMRLIDQGISPLALAGAGRYKGIKIPWYLKEQSAYRTFMESFEPGLFEVMGGVGGKKYTHRAFNWLIDNLTKGETGKLTNRWMRAEAKSPGGGRQMLIAHLKNEQAVANLVREGDKELLDAMGMARVIEQGGVLSEQTATKMALSLDKLYRHHLRLYDDETMRGIHARFAGARGKKGKVAKEAQITEKEWQQLNQAWDETGQVLPTIMAPKRFLAENPDAFSAMVASGVDKAQNYAFYPLEVMTRNAKAGAYRHFYDQRYSQLMEGSSGSERAIRLASQAAEDYAAAKTNELMYRGFRTSYESSARNVFPFAAAWRDFLVYWSKAAIKRPTRMLLWAKAQEDIPEEVDAPKWLQDGAISALHAIGLDGLSPLTTWKMNPRNAMFFTGGVGGYIPAVGPIVTVPAARLVEWKPDTFDWITDIPGLAFANPNSPMFAKLDKLLWGVTGKLQGGDEWPMWARHMPAPLGVKDETLRNKANAEYQWQAAQYLKSVSTGKVEELSQDTINHLKKLADEADDNYEDNTILQFLGQYLNPMGLQTKPPGELLSVALSMWRNATMADRAVLEQFYRGEVGKDQLPEAYQDRAYLMAPLPPAALNVFEGMMKWWSLPQQDVPDADVASYPSRTNFLYSRPELIPYTIKTTEYDSGEYVPLNKQDVSKAVSGELEQIISLMYGSKWRNVKGDANLGGFSGRKRRAELEKLRDHLAAQQPGGALHPLYTIDTPDGKKNLDDLINSLPGEKKAPDADVQAQSLAVSALSGASNIGSYPEKATLQSVAPYIETKKAEEVAAALQKDDTEKTAKDWELVGRPAEPETYGQFWTQAWQAEKKWTATMKAEQGESTTFSTKAGKPYAEALDAELSSIAQAAGETWADRWMLSKGPKWRVLQSGRYGLDDPTTSSEWRKTYEILDGMTQKMADAPDAKAKEQAYREAMAEIARLKADNAGYAKQFGMLAESTTKPTAAQLRAFKGDYATVAHKRSYSKGKGGRKGLRKATGGKKGRARVSAGKSAGRKARVSRVGRGGGGGLPKTRKRRRI